MVNLKILGQSGLFHGLICPWNVGKILKKKLWVWRFCYYKKFVWILFWSPQVTPLSTTEVPLYLIFIVFHYHLQLVLVPLFFHFYPIFFTYFPMDLFSKQSCRLLYSFWANLLYSLNTWFYNLSSICTYSTFTVFL